MKVLGRKQFKPSQASKNKYLVDLGNAAWGVDSEVKHIRSGSSIKSESSTKCRLQEFKSN